MRRILTSLIGGIACSLMAAESPSTRLWFEVEGVSGELESNILAFVGAQDKGLPFTELQAKNFQRKADARVKQALEALGYYQPTTETELQSRKDGWTLLMRVQPGPPVRIRKLELLLSKPVRELPAVRDYLASLPLAEGEIFHHGRYEQLKRDLLALVQSWGYLDAEWEVSRVQLSETSQQAEIELSMASGEQYRFGALSYADSEQQLSLRQRMELLKVGEPYSRKRLIAQQRSYEASGFYDSVQLQPQMDKVQDGQVPVQVVLVPKVRFFYSLKGGVSTDLGPYVSTGLENRRINNSGHSLDSSLELSRQTRKAEVGYNVPLSNPATDKIRYSLSREEIEDPLGINRNSTLAVQRYSQNSAGINATQSLSLLYSDFELKDSDRQTDTLLVLPELGWNRLKLDDPIRTRRGYRWSAKVSATDPGLGSSDLSFIQTRLDWAAIRELKPSHRVKGRLQLGYTRIVQDEFDEFMPLNLRFAAGGDTSVRGYGWRKLSPTDDEGKVVGGRHLLVGSLEYDKLFLPDWRWSVFADTGNAFNDWGQPDLHTGIGAGVHWLSPVGPIRLQLAHALDEPGGFRIHLTMGPDL